MILLKVIGEMKILLEMWKDRSGGIAGFSIGGLLQGVLGSVLSTVVGSLFGSDPKPSAKIAAEGIVGKEIKEPDKAGQVIQAQDRSRRRKAAAVGRQGTILTSPLGLTGDEDIARPSLLGR